MADTYAYMGDNLSLTTAVTTVPGKTKYQPHLSMGRLQCV